MITNKAIFSDGETFIPDQGRNYALGEVFTPKDVIEKMIILARIDKSEFDSTIFEPAAGTGNFTIEILNSKLKKIYDDIKEFDAKDFLVEYEIRSILALASITFNDIDTSNIERIKHRLNKMMEENYIAVFFMKRSVTKRIPNHYLKAIADILSSNAILGDFISSKKKKFLFVRYYRYKKNRIIRCVYQLDKIIDNNIFSNDPTYMDNITYKNWVLEIDGHDIAKENIKFANNTSK